MPNPPTLPESSRATAIVGWGLAVAMILGLFAFYPAFSQRSGSSAFGWLGTTWNSRNNLEHCYFLPFIAAWLVWRKRGEIDWAMPRPNALGLIVLGVGVLMFIASMRVSQQRVAIASFPFFVAGAALYLGGAKAAKRFAFPAFLIYFAVPIPGLLQATNGLQLIATRAAHSIATVGGVDAVRAGNYISSESDKWGFDVAEGCSGIRSLMVLTLTAAILAHLTQTKIWKKLALFSCAVPLAVIANSVRVASVILLAEYGDPEFAASLYHDYSTLVFYPLALGMLLLIAGLLRGCGKARMTRTRSRSRIVTRKEALET